MIYFGSNFFFSIQAKPSGIATDLSKLFPSNFDLVVCCVDDPNTLAKDACEAGLLSQEMMAMLTSNSDMNNKAKTRSILNCILGEVSHKPHLSRNLLVVLRNQPDVKNLLIALQVSGELNTRVSIMHNQGFI